MLAAAIAAAMIDLRPADLPRWNQFEAHLGLALRGAMAEGTPGDLARLLDAFDGAPGRLAPEGRWRCRWIKMGELAPLVVYEDFACEIARDGAGWRLQKLTGSQRFSGRIATDGTYTGTAYVAGGPATDYAGLPPDDQTPMDPGQTVAQVGLFEQAGRASARLLLPDPVLESLFDVIHFTR